MDIVNDEMEAYAVRRTMPETIVCSTGKAAENRYPAALHTKFVPIGVNICIFPDFLKGFFHLNIFFAFCSFSKTSV